MLNLESALEIAGVTVFRDYNTQNRFYYAPMHPELSSDSGEKMFQLLVYRDDVAERDEFKSGDRDGGGFLTMTVDLAVSESVRQTVRSELASRVGGDVDLVPVPFKRGSVRVTALGASAGAAPGLGDDQREAGFVEEILGSATPSLYADNRAVFSMELSQRGALLMEASIRAGGASQVAVVYSLDYKGLMPARECKITIDFKQSYRYLRTRAQVNTLWFKADIDAEVERLMKEGSIKIEDVDYLGLEPGELAARATALTALAKELATWSFFKPGLQPGRVLAQDRGELSVYDPTTAASANTAAFTTPLEVAATGRGDSGDTDGPRHRGRSATTASTRAGGSEPPAAGASGATGSGAAAGSGRRELTAVERWNRAGRPQAGFLLKSLSQEEQQKITFDLRQVSAHTRSMAPQSSIRFASGNEDLSDRIVFVDLDNPFFDVLSGSVTSSADFAAEGVRSMVVKLRYGQREDGSGPKDTKEVVLSAAGDSGTFNFHLDHRFSMELEYQVIVHYRDDFAIGDDSASATSPWIRTSTRNLDIDPRVVGDAIPVTLTAGQVDWNSVRSIQAEVVYEDSASGIEATATKVLTQGEGSTAVVHIRPKQGGSESYTVNSTFFYESTREGPISQLSSGPQLIVVNQPPSKAVPVNVNLVDPMARIKKAIVELSYENQRHSVELSGDGGSETWTFFRDSLADEARYTYRTTIFGNDGTTRRSDRVETAERSLIVGDVVEGILEVEARVLSTDLAAAGILLAKLRLEYPDAPDWADAVDEVTFERSPEAFDWRVPKKPGGGDEYTYTMEWFRADGTRETVGPETVRDEVLILIPPARS